MQSRNVNEIDNKHSSELYLSTKSVIDSFQISNHFVVQRQFLYYIIQQVLIEVQNVFYPNSFQDCVLVEDCLAL